MNGLVRRAVTSRHLAQYFSALAGPFATIFMLHRPATPSQSFRGISEELLEQCLGYAQTQGYQFLSVDELAEHALKRRALTRPTLCFTLDDGYADQVARLVPVLLKYEAKPTLFVITDFVDGRDWPWDAKLAYVAHNTSLQACEIVLGSAAVSLDLSTEAARAGVRRVLAAHAKILDATALRDFLAQVASACQVTLPTVAPEAFRSATWQELRESESRGLRVGSHACSHLVLNAMTDEQVAVELVASKARIVAEMSQPSEVFCYPSGTNEDFDRRHEALVRDSGYTAAVSAEASTAFLKDIRHNPYRIARIGFPNSLDWFVRYASWLEALRSKLPV